MNKILVSRTDGIGDLLLTTPLFYELRKKYPTAYISALVSPYSADLLLNNPAVSDVILYNKDMKKQTFEKIMSGKYDVVISVYPRPELAWTFFRIGIPLRYGTNARWYSFMYNRRIKISRKKSEKHEAEYNLMIAGDLIDKAAAEREYYYITQEEKQAGEEYLKSKGITGNFIVLHPFSNGSAWNLSWKKYAELAAKIVEAGFCVLLTGGHSEKEGLKRIKNFSGKTDGLFIMDKNLELRIFAAVISHADVVVSCSTGPMHIAAALKVRTLSFFPPDSITAMKPSRWKPLGNVHEIIQPDRNDMSSMDDIDCDFIISKIKLLLEKK
jgi:ADP-heptose:LPS heptosyltransferase